MSDTLQAGSYYEIKRTWKKESKVILDMTVLPVLMVSNPMAAENRCSVAVKRGPIVYCFEGIDNPGISVRQARLKVDPEKPGKNLKAKFYSDLLGGITIINARGTVPVEDWGPLYRIFKADPVKIKSVDLKAIPYYAWNNRGISDMTVWTQIDKEEPLTGRKKEKIF